MNANELADEMYRHLYNDGVYTYTLEKTMDEAATMLRQQQSQLDACRESKKEDVAEIYKLQAEIEVYKEAALQRLSDFTQEAEHKPVAFLSPDKKEICFIDKSVKPKNSAYLAHWMMYWDRLYTHPVKELTDDEIIKVYESMLGFVSKKGSAINFARAILRKAQSND